MTQKTYHPQTAKFIATVCENMPELTAEVMQGWIGDPKSLQKALREALSPNGKPATGFPVWRTITLGHYQVLDGIQDCLKRQGVRVSDWAADIMNQPGFTLSPEKTEIELIVLSVKDLGFPKGAAYREICDKAKEFGLHLCPPEVGPALRYQYPDQPRDEWLTIAMESITDSGGSPGVFCVGHDYDDRWLNARWGRPDDFWRAAGRFVFAK